MIRKNCAVGLNYCPCARLQVCAERYPAFQLCVVCARAYGLKQRVFVLLPKRLKCGLRVFLFDQQRRLQVSQVDSQ
jgi:hypothetical protein